MGGKIMKNEYKEAMKNVRKTINSRNYSDTIVSFNEIPIPETYENTGWQLTAQPYHEDELIKSVININKCNKIEYYKEITGNGSIFDGIIIIIKRLIRKAVHFLIKPLIDDQNMFNLNTSVSVAELTKYAIESQKKNDYYENEILYLKKEIQRMKGSFESEDIRK